MTRRYHWLFWLLGLCLLSTPTFAEQVLQAPGVQVKLSGTTGDYATALKLLLGLTILSLAPAILMCTTSFVRIIVVFSMLRHAFGMQETPPNLLLISLALFLTFFTMAPVTQRIQDEAITPYLAHKINDAQAFERGVAPLKEFMVRQTRESDLEAMLDIAKAPRPSSIGDISMLHLMPAFMMSELRTAFRIGFVIFLPFLLIDLVVASGLMALGMMMTPPTTVALPLKILLFVMIDGWNLVVRALLNTFV